MGQIHKHPVAVPGRYPDDPAAEIPGFIPMTIGIDGQGDIVVWGAGGTNGEGSVPFRVAFTGGTISSSERIIDTVVTPGGLVWHLVVASQ